MNDDHVKLETNEMMFVILSGEQKTYACSLDYCTVVVVVNVDDRRMAVDVLDNDISLDFDENVMELSED